MPDTCPPGKAQVLNYLAYSWVDQSINIDEAFKMLTRAVELAPRDGMIIDSPRLGLLPHGPLRRRRARA